MKENKIVEAVGKVDDKYLNESINFKAKKRNVSAGVMGFAAMAASLLLIFGMGMFRSDVKANSVVSIDINPSIEITVNKHDKVVATNALNEDAQIVLQGMDLKNVDLDIALNAIIGSLLKNGYLDEVYNVVNVCVENDDEERAGELGEKVSGEISSLFDEKDLIGGVNTQLCTSNDEMKKLADSYGISVGKLNLAQQVSENMGISLDIAVGLSIPELWDLLDAESAELISKNEALQIAIDDAKIVESDITLVNVKIQESGGVFIYAINITVGENHMYEYKVDAVSGTILACEYSYITEGETGDDEVVDGDVAEDEATEESKDETAEDETTEESKDETAEDEATEESKDETVEDETDSSVEEDASTESTEETEPVPSEPVKQITKKEALEIAYADAGIDENDVKLEELKHKPKEKEYHIEFSVGLCDYTYIIDAVDGSIIRTEVIDKTGASDITATILPVDEALELALNKLGIKLTDLEKCDIKFTNKKEGAEYKIHFHIGKAHYEYIVNAVTGEITEKTHPAPVPPHEKEEAVKPVPPHEKEEAAKPVPPHEKEKAEKPVPPHEKEEAAKPVPPHEKEEATKPAPPKPHEKPLGPEDSKVTITFE